MKKNFRKREFIKRILRKSSFIIKTYARWINGPNTKIIPIDINTFNPKKELNLLDGIILTGGGLNLYNNHIKKKYVQEILISKKSIKYLKIIKSIIKEAKKLNDKG